MYKEEAKYPTGRLKENLLFYGGLAAVVLLTSLLSGWLAAVGLKHADFLAFGVLAALADLILYQRIFRYQYEIIGDDLIISRRYGEHEKHMVAIGIDSIVEIGAYDKELKMTTLQCCVFTNKLKKTQILYEKNGKCARIVLQPSETMAQKLQEMIAEKKELNNANIEEV